MRLVLGLFSLLILSTFLTTAAGAACTRGYIGSAIGQSNARCYINHADGGRSMCTVGTVIGGGHRCTEDGWTSIPVRQISLEDLLEDAAPAERVSILAIADPEALTAAEIAAVLANGASAEIASVLARTEPEEPVRSTWTPWLNRDRPGGSGDYDKLDDHLADGNTCAAPIDVECRAVASTQPASETGQNVTCTLERGFICRNAEQDGAQCLDYEVRFLCPSTTPAETRD
ncbi:hypothetical protein [Hyphobacterium sp.]|uniref:hypothetical protein n=1 Tax=Hyphobacterium sp. TaxID=2004662 RepID=UPI003BA87C8C